MSLKDWRKAIRYNYFWARVLPKMFESKGKIALVYYYTMIEFQRWNIPATEESMRDWHNIEIIVRIADEVLSI